MMPRLDGFGLIRAVRADPQLRAIPMILLSARAGEESRIEGLDRGADDYLVKPFSARELLVRAGTLIRSAELRRRAEEARAQFETLLNEAPLGVYPGRRGLPHRGGESRRAAADRRAAELIGRDFDSVVHAAWPSADAEEIVRRFRHTLRDRRAARRARVHRPAQGSPGDGVLRVAGQSHSAARRPARRRVLLPRHLAGASWRAKHCAKRTAARTSSWPRCRTSCAIRWRRCAARWKSSSGSRARRRTRRRRCEIMDRQLSHLVRLVDDLLEVSRITRGQVELRREHVRLDAAIHSAIETSEPLIRAGEPSPDRLAAGRAAAARRGSGAARADLRQPAQQRREVFGEGRADRDRGAPRRRARRSSRSATAATASRPSSCRKLFEIFTRGERSARRNQSGLGIGLALVRRLTEMHGGRVEAVERRPRQGQLLQRAVAAERPAGGGGRRRGGREHSSIEALGVLVVDDNTRRG